MVSDPARYRSATGHRLAKQEHLRQQPGGTVTPLDRLRKEVAHQRLLARLVLVAPKGSWALKGGQALLARLDDRARATRDADATWRSSLDGFGEVLTAAVERDLDDGFQFEVSTPRPMTAETDEGGLRYPILTLLDGREFERLQLDVNAVPDDHRPLEEIRLRDLLPFTHIPPPRVPIIPIAQHLAEKLHAFTRDYGARPNSRPRDLFDMLVIARSLPIPPPGALRASCTQTFALRDTSWPPVIRSAPADWQRPWAAFVADHRVPWKDLDHADDALRSFWEPIVKEDPTMASATWRPDRWSWAAA